MAVVRMLACDWHARKGETVMASERVTVSFRTSRQKATLDLCGDCNAAFRDSAGLDMVNLEDETPLSGKERAPCPNGCGTKAVPGAGMAAHLRNCKKRKRSS